MIALLAASVLVCLLLRAGIGEMSLKSITQELEGTFGLDDEEGGKHCSYLKLLLSPHVA